MNILLIGNGFDLAHDLPTRYDDFLNFLSACRIRESGVTDSHKIKATNIRDEIGEYILAQWNSNRWELGDLKTHMAENIWIDYFLKIKSRLKDKGWIDFEQEISKAIQNIDKMESVVDKHDKWNYVVNIEPMISTLSHYGLIDKTNYITKGPELTERLISDLDRLIRCLEIYLCLTLDLVHPAIRLQTISNILSDVGSIDGVLSFNYTDTFEKYYEAQNSKRPEYCFVHGRARIENDLILDNMVLGIDEYLDEQDRNTKIEYIHFKKYYQRIFKQTDYNYTKWLRKPEPKRLFIIGHSLDITDKDVLREILTADNVETTIYYHSKEANAKQIKNLIKLLGYDKLNELTRGRGGLSSITFAHQLS